MSEMGLVMGASGSGKSTAGRTLDPASTFWINVVSKPLPFKGWKAKYVNGKNMLCSTDAGAIVNKLKEISAKMPHIKTVVLDDGQYVMSNELMVRAKEKGFDKFTEIAMKMYTIMKTSRELRDDLYVFFLMHTDEVSINGYTVTKLKTIGKMLDNTITLEGLFTVVLLTTSYKDSDKKIVHKFVTQSDGTNTVKTPMGMFDELYIDNDLQYVLDKINEYNN